MSCKNTEVSYGCVSKTIHSFLAIFVTLEIIMGLFTGYLPNRVWRGNIFAVHKSLGVILFFVLLIYIIWKLFNIKPNFPTTMKCWEACLARFVHPVLLWSAFIMSASGWIMKTALGKAPLFFWIFKWPMPFIPLDKNLANTAHSVHIIVAWVVSITLCLHIVGALKNHFIDKNNILRRMFQSKIKCVGHIK